MISIQWNEPVPKFWNFSRNMALIDQKEMWQKHNILLLLIIGWDGREYTCLKGGSATGMPSTPGHKILD